MRALKHILPSMIFIICASVLQCSCESAAQDKVCFGSKCVKVETVSTPAEMAKGLQFRAFLPQDAGMLFVFRTSDIHRFWMKDTLIPLDMIWMDADKRIVDILKNVPPCQTDPCPIYTPKENSLYVLEVNANYTDSLGINIDDRARFRLRN